MPFLRICEFVAVVSAILLGAIMSDGGECPHASGPIIAFDAAPFAASVIQEAGKSYGVCWSEPRKIRRLEVEFERDAVLPAADTGGVQYWYRNWDGHPDPVRVETGAGHAGWTKVDDWFNGQWKDADARVQVDGKRWIFTFAPTGEKEFQNLGNPGVAYRKTLKIRVLAKGVLPKPKRFQAFTDAECRPLTVRILWDQPAVAGLRVNGPNAGWLQVYNGSVVAVRPYGDAGVVVGDDLRWTLPAGTGKRGGIEADLLMAVDPADDTYDRTIVTVRCQHNPFSFAADEIVRGNRILVDDLGTLVVRGDDAISVEDWRQALKEFPGRTVYDRVASREQCEQTLPRAWNDMPLRRKTWFVHGLPGNRNVFRQDPNGEITISSDERWFGLPRSPKDTDRKGWAGQRLFLGFGFPSQECRAGREMLDGYLPLLRTWWVDGPLYYEQSTILDKLDPDLDNIRLDDPTVLLMCVRVVNTSDSVKGTAHLRLVSHPAQDIKTYTGKTEKLRVEGDRVIAESKTAPQFRYLFKTGDCGVLKQVGDAVEWSLDLAPGQSHRLALAIPSITLDKPEEIDALEKRDFQVDSRRVCELWKRLTTKSTQIETPEPWLNDFYKAQLQHIEINCIRDIAATRRYAKVGSFRYGVYGNESAMVISELDRRGCHRAAEECLQTMLDFQGTVQLPGNFKTLDGVFNGANGYENGGYNKHHGYMMWNMAEHWWYTRDRRWMEQAAGKLVKACDWVTRERQATMTQNPDGKRAIEHGFLPAGALEDVQDYWYWLATNVNTVWGFDALAAALADYGHPDGPRLLQEARAYHDDVLRGLAEARIRTPVVRLRDGTYVPKFPSHLHERGRSLGWIRETLEGSLFLLINGLIPPDAPEATWIVKDYEDNLYISDSYGYAIPVFDRFWFSRGGFSMQANLLDGPIPYLNRDEIKHYLRAFFNGFASAFSPELRLCIEHSIPELGYPAGGLFKTSDESNVSYWLRLMFVHEQGNDLYLGQALPRYWLTQGQRVGIDRAASHFGPLSLWITSRVDQGEIRATVTPPERNRPKTIFLRLRHPEAKPIQSVTLNGKAYDKFNAQKEWIVLPGDVRGQQEVVARY